MDALTVEFRHSRTAFSSTLGFVLAWTLAGGMAVELNAMTLGAGIPSWIDSLFHIYRRPLALSMLECLVFGLLLAAVQWTVLRAFFNGSAFGWKLCLPAGRPAWHLWIAASAGGSLLRGLLLERLTIPATTYCNNLFDYLTYLGGFVVIPQAWVDFLTLLVFAGAARLAVAACQWVVLRMWFGSRAGWWFAFDLAAHIAISAGYAGLLPASSDWLTNGLITGLGLALIIRQPAPRAASQPSVPAVERSRLLPAPVGD
jgi:hypothetical protein